MKIIFIGTSSFAAPSLSILLENKYKISAVVTVPDKFCGRGLKLRYSAIKEEALKHNLTLLQPDDLEDKDFEEAIKNLEPDLIIVVAFRKIPSSIWKIPKEGTINLHSSLLPNYRGAAPMNWAIINGEKETGVTTFFINDCIDTGNIILNKKAPIKFTDTVEDLHDRLSNLGAKLILETVKLIEKSDFCCECQEELIEKQGINKEELKKAPKIYKHHCNIDWNKSAIEIYNHIRGLSPIPGAYTIIQSPERNKMMLKIFFAEISKFNDESLLPGNILVAKNNFYIKALDKILEIKDLQLECRKRLKVDAFLRGTPINSSWKVV